MVLAFEIGFFRNEKSDVLFGEKCNYLKFIDSDEFSAIRIDKKCDNDTKVHDKNDIHRNAKLL